MTVTGCDEMGRVNFVAALDPALSQAIATLTGALAMLIISAASYYFPRGKDRFSKRNDDSEEEDDIEEEKPSKRRKR